MKERSEGLGVEEVKKKGDEWIEEEVEEVEGDVREGLGVGGGGIRRVHEAS